MRRLFFASLLVAVASAAAPTTAPPADDRLRLGFTYAMFVGVNENDARASVRALSETIAHDSGFSADPTPQIFNQASEIHAAVHAGVVDAVALTTVEFQALPDRSEFDRYLFSIYGTDPAEEYVLLVPRGLALTRLDELRGRRLTIVDGPRLCLAQPWLEVALARADLPETARFFSRIERQPKASRAILDAYFKKTDVCLTTRRSLAVMSELNPQIGTQLQVIASSGPLIPSMFAIRTGFAQETKERMIRVFRNIHRTIPGRQALTIFQVNEVAELPSSALAPALDLLAEFQRLRPAVTSVAAPGSPTEGSTSP